MAYSNWTLSGLTLYVEDVSAVQVPGTLKQKVGKNLVKHAIVGRDALDWELSVTGVCQGSTKDNQRTDINALRSALSSNALTNGVHDGNYIVEEVNWQDPGTTAGAFWRYSLKLTQFQQ